MNHKPRAKVVNIRVDWSDPRLESLLRRSENWSLDQRDGHSPQEVQVYLESEPVAGRSATLVWQRQHSVVLLANFSLEKGDRVRVDKHLGDRISSVRGVVVDGRESYRKEDFEQGLRVYWLHIR